MNKPKIGDTPNQLEVRMLIDGKMWSGDDITKMAKENQALKDAIEEIQGLIVSYKDNADHNVYMVADDEEVLCLTVGDIECLELDVADLLNKLRG